MSKTAGITQWVVRIAGLTQIGLGILIWMGWGQKVLPVHIMNGFLIVLALWLLSILALVAGVARGLAIFALVWGVALPSLGMTQPSILPGPGHRVIRVIHLVMGLAALGMGDRLASAIRARSRGGSP